MTTQPKPKLGRKPLGKRRLQTTLSPHAMDRLRALAALQTPPGRRVELGAAIERLVREASVTSWGVCW